MMNVLVVPTGRFADVPQFSRGFAEGGAGSQAPPQVRHAL
jgi:hypothetical protein